MSSFTLQIYGEKDSEYLYRSYALSLWQGSKVVAKTGAGGEFANLAQQVLNILDEQSALSVTLELTGDVPRKEFLERIISLYNASLAKKQSGEQEFSFAQTAVSD